MTNSGSSACFGLLDPVVLPLDSGGRDLRVTSVAVASATQGLSLLAPGATTKATTFWSGPWCGTPSGDKVGVRLTSTDEEFPVQLRGEPAQPECKSGSGGDIMSTYFQGGLTGPDAVGR
jgi:hypothetical protein